MEEQITTAAANFVSSYFTDTALEQEQFMVLLEYALQRYQTGEDKVLFLNEVIRLGRLFLKESLATLTEMEKDSLTNTAARNALLEGFL